MAKNITRHELLGRLRVGQRLALSSAALVALLFITAGVSLWSMGRMRESTEKINTGWLPSVKALGNINTAKSDFRAFELQHILSNDDASRADVEKRMTAKLSEFEALGESYAKLIGGRDERRTYEAFKADWNAYLREHDRLIAVSRRNEDEEAKQLIFGESRRLYDSAAESLMKSVDINQRGAIGEGANSDKLYASAHITMVAAAVLSVALAISLALLVIRSIVHELGGEPTEAARFASAIAEGDLVQSIVVEAGDHTSLVSRLVTMQHSLRQVVSNVRQNSESVATASAQIAQGNQDLSIRTEEQASALQQTASTMEQLGATVSKNADNARQANQLALGAVQVAAQGGEVVGRVIATMQKISDSSRRIGDIIGVIDGIAFQTNILALNAAVEAARAGEQGRGFAVVASEVRSLARRSAEAAREIKTLIGQSVDRVEQGTALVDQAGQTMGEIVGSIQRVSEIVAEISLASVEQSSGVQRVGETIAQMDKVTQQNAALVEESAAASESLNVQAQQLVSAVAVFKLAGDARRVVYDYVVPTATSEFVSVRYSAKPPKNGVSPRPRLGLATTPDSPATPNRAEGASAKPGAEDWASF